MRGCLRDGPHAACPKQSDDLVLTTDDLTDGDVGHALGPLQSEQINIQHIGAQREPSFSGGEGRG